MRNVNTRVNLVSQRRRAVVHTLAPTVSRAYVNYVTLSLFFRPRHWRARSSGLFIDTRRDPNVWARRARPPRRAHRENSKTEVIPADRRRPKRRYPVLKRRLHTAPRGGAFLAAR